MLVFPIEAQSAAEVPDPLTTEPAVPLAFLQTPDWQAYQ